MQSLNAEGVPYSGHSYERVATEVSSCNSRTFRWSTSTRCALPVDAPPCNSLS